MSTDMGFESAPSDDSTERKPTRTVPRWAAWIMTGAGVLAGAAGGVYFAYDQGKHAGTAADYNRGVADGSNNCLQHMTYTSTQEIPLNRTNVGYVTALINSPAAPHVDYKELQDMGYTQLTQAFDAGARVVNFLVPFDAHNPPPDSKSMNKLLDDANNLSSAIRLNLAGEDDLVQSAITVPAAQAYPQAPIKMVIEVPSC